MTSIGENPHFTSLLPGLRVELRHWRKSGFIYPLLFFYSHFLTRWPWRRSASGPEVSGMRQPRAYLLLQRCDRLPPGLSAGSTGFWGRALHPTRRFFSFRKRCLLFCFCTSLNKYQVSNNGLGDKRTNLIVYASTQITGLPDLPGASHGKARSEK